MIIVCMKVIETFTDWAEKMEEGYLEDDVEGDENATKDSFGDSESLDHWLISKKNTKALVWKFRSRWKWPALLYGNTKMSIILPNNSSKRF